MLGDIDLPTFINSRQKEFMKQQRTDEQYAYILSHALVTFWIEKVPRQILRDFVLSFQNKDDSSIVSERIDKVYTGGFKQFEKILKPSANSFIFFYLCTGYGISL